MTDTRTSYQLAERLPPKQWTDIATSVQHKGGFWDWAPAEGAPLTITQCRRLYDEGFIEIAQRRVGVGHVVMVAMPRRAQDPRRIPWFSRPDDAHGARSVA